MSTTAPPKLEEDLYLPNSLAGTAILFCIGLLVFIVYIYICLKSFEVYTGPRYYNIRDQATVLNANVDGSISQSVNEPPPPYSDEEVPATNSEDQFALPPPYPADETAPPLYSELDLPPPYPGIFDVEEARCLFPEKSQQQQEIAEYQDDKSGMEN